MTHLLHYTYEHNLVAAQSYCLHKYFITQSTYCPNSTQMFYDHTTLLVHHPITSFIYQFCVFKYSISKFTLKTMLMAQLWPHRIAILVAIVRISCSMFNGMQLSPEIDRDEHAVNSACYLA